ncbi:MAG: M56 family metallopeptidase [Faecousia sp.]
MSELFRNVLTASFHGSIVIAAVIVLRLLLKKTPKKFLCFLWLLAGIRLLMPFEIQSSLSLQPDTSSVVLQQQTVEPEPLLFVEEEPEQPVTALEDTPVIHNDVPQAESPGVSAAGKDDVSRQVSSNSAGQVEPAVDWAALVPYFWFAVACCFGLSSLYSYLRLRYQVREAIKIPSGWECDRIETAFILGFIRPQIYIPMGMSASNRKYILAHERTHLEKGDHWFKMIGYIALAIHWFNPLVWVAYTLLCKDIEMACDERVVQFMDLEERKCYSAALLSCSTNRAHFAACPVAFGEVSVKARIKSVLNYRRPSFWISLLGVIAILFVAVCLVTNPTKEKSTPATGEITAAAEETTPGETEPIAVETEGKSTYAATLTQDDIEEVCTKAIEDLCSRESYLISRKSSYLYPERGDQAYTSASLVRRYGNDMLDLQLEQMDNGEITYLNSSLYFGDMYGSHYGDYWVNEGSRSALKNDDPNAWLKDYSPEGKTVTFPEGTGVISDDSVSFGAQWTDSYGWNQEYSGVITFTFHDDGTVAEIRREYTRQTEDDGSEAVLYTNVLTVETEDPQDTYHAIEEQAVACIPVDQLEQVRRERDKITEIPSNKTDYDKDFMLGSGQMRWYFFDQAWQFALGAENASATGLTLKYCESGDDHQSLVAEEGFWLEKLVGGVWIVLEPAKEVTNAPATAIHVSWSTEDRVSINWQDSYGTLDRGFYRLGRYYTATMASGESETIHCYAKFRVYDPNNDALLNQCKSAIDALINSSSYHLYSFNWLTEQNYDYCLSSEVWKNGPDYLEVTRYPLRKNLTQMQSVRGGMWRDGEYYGLEWSGEPAVSPVSSWWLGVDGYMDDSNFSMWSWDFQWYDAKVEDVYQEGNTIHILETYDVNDKYTNSEITLTFDGNGKLTGMTKSYLPTADCAEKDKIVNVELVVYDTSASEIARTIDSQNVSEPMVFSYAEDVKNTPNAQTGGFRNTTQKLVKTTADAVALADKECAMSRILDFDNGYLQTRTYHDDAAGMWKVELFWWQHDTATTVYLNDQGITQRIVTVE